MGSAPKITVYVVSHNLGKYLSDAIESVLRQTTDGWEMLVINDGSTDNTEEVTNLYKGDPRIRILKTPGIGLPAVCNLALKEARGEYLIRLDGDDVFDENILLVLGNYLDREPHVALVFPDYYLIDERGEIFAQERRAKLYSSNHVLDMPAHGACTMVRTAVLKKLGGYREDLGVQDGFDLWSRILEGHKAGNVNIPLFYYRRHDLNITNNPHRIIDARRKIKLDAVKDRLDMLRPIIGVIPCRRNYDFTPDLWRQEVNGKPLLLRAIELCARSKIFDHIVIASDNPDVKSIMKQVSDTRLEFFLRRTEDTIRSRSIADTLSQVSSVIPDGAQGTSVISYIQAPFVKTETLEEAVSTLALNNADSSMGVQEVVHPIYRRTSYGLELINRSGDLTTDVDTLYGDANTAFATRNRNFKSGSMIGPMMVNFLVHRDECFFIDSARKLKIAQILAQDMEGAAAVASLPAQGARRAAKT